MSFNRPEEWFNELEYRSVDNTQSEEQRGIFFNEQSLSRAILKGLTYV